LPSLERLPGWFDLTAVREAHVAVADGNKYFNRSGTTVVKTVEIIAEILHGYKSEPAQRNTAWQMVTYPVIRAEEFCRF
jgi:ABC-type Fe3+-hydroxamate transport system substrate-binding protein